jgi:hypothetical protein
MKASAKVRAARLVAKIERAIERGEFTPEIWYLHDSIRLGPCGCAVAAGQFVHGVKPPALDEDELGVTAFDGLSLADAEALERGYEHRARPWEFPVRQGDRKNSFFLAGEELAKFNPMVRR